MVAAVTSLEAEAIGVFRSIGRDWEELSGSDTKTHGANYFVSLLRSADADSIKIACERLLIKLPV